MKLFVLSCCMCLVVGLPINDPLTNESDIEADVSSSVPSVPASLNLPSNASAIRAEITDNFSCKDRIYGYYADVENDCQIFHICLPVTYADGKEKMFRWSFVCPDETIFSQEHFTCIRPADWAGNCSDSEKFVALNQQFGMSAAETMDNDEVFKDTPQMAPKNRVRINNNVPATHSIPNSLLSDPIEEIVISIDTKRKVVDVLQNHPASTENDLQQQIETVNKEISQPVRRNGFYITTDTAPIDLDTDLQTTTDDSIYQSTVSWNVYTESLYDGVTVDDNVEVEAVTEENVSNRPVDFV